MQLSGFMSFLISLIAFLSIVYLVILKFSRFLRGNIQYTTEIWVSLEAG